MKSLLLFPAVVLALCLGANECLAQVGELSGDSVRTYLEEFKKADTDSSGLLEKEELATYLQSFPEALGQLLSKIPDEGEGVSRDQLLQAATHFKRIKGYDPRTEPDQQKAFARWDSNEDGKLNAEELSIVLPAELREPLKKKLAAKGSVTFADYLEGFGQFVRAGEVRRTVLSVAPPEDMPPSDVPSPESLKKKIAAFLTVAEAKKKNAQPADVVEVIEEMEVEGTESSLLFGHFDALDRDGNGVLDRSEMDRAHPSLRTLFRGKTKVTVEDFERYVTQLRAIGERSESSRLRAFVDLLDDVQGEASANAPAAVEVEVEEERAVEAPAEVAVEKSVPFNSVTVEVVLLRRKSAKLPQRSLSEEALEVVGEAGPSLSARLLPWLADEENMDTQLIDYARVTSVGGNEGMVQRGGREPFVSSNSSRGGRSYSVNNVGTLIRMTANSTEDGKIVLDMAFEKSFVDPAPVEEKDNEEEATAEEVSEAPMGRAAVDPREAALRAFRGMSEQAVTPPSIFTMTVTSVVTATPGKPVVLSETGQWQADQYDETIILVEVRP